MHAKQGCHTSNVAALALLSQLKVGDYQALYIQPYGGESGRLLLMLHLAVIRVSDRLHIAIVGERRC